MFATPRIPQGYGPFWDHFFSPQTAKRRDREARATNLYVDFLFAFQAYTPGVFQILPAIRARATPKRRTPRGFGSNSVYPSSPEAPEPDPTRACLPLPQSLTAPYIGPSRDPHFEANPHRTALHTRPPTRKTHPLKSLPASANRSFFPKQNTYITKEECCCNTPF